jgi:hypothetical protein
MPLIPLDEGGFFTELERSWASKERAALIGTQAGLYHLELAQTYFQGYPPELHQAVSAGVYWLRDLAPRYNVVAALVPNELATSYQETGATLAAQNKDGLAVLRLKDPWPRAYLAGGLQPDPRQHWIEQVAQLPQGRVVIATAEPDSHNPQGGVRMLRYQPERVELDASSDRSAWLVLNDLYSAGWLASIDGASVPIIKANHLVRAIRLPAGARHVVFSYEAPGLRLGLILSAVSLLAACLLLGLRTWWKWLRP